MQLLSCRSRRGVGQSARRFDQQNALRTRDHQVQGLSRSNELLRSLPSFPEVRRTRPQIVSVSRQNVHDPLLQHALGQAGQDMRGTSGAFDTVFYIGTGHRLRSLQIGGSAAGTCK